MGTRGISAIKWFAHYILNALFLWFGIIAVEMMYCEIIRKPENLIS